jgi:uncharacterized membrane protein
MFKSWAILLLAVLVGWAFGKYFKKKDKGFSWPAFFVSLFIFLGGLDYFFDVLGNTFEFLGKIIGFLFWIGIVVALYYGAKKLIEKSRKRRDQQPPVQEPPAQQPPAPPTPPAV